MQLGKTKAEMITMNVLGPSTVGEVVSYLSPAEAEPVYFSLASDWIREPEKCFQYAWGIDFFEDSDETANGIHQALMTCLENYKLDIRNVIAYVADNVNVNYGKHHSVYKLNSANEGILKANCLAHIAHNTCKHASD